jgi:tRNA 2-thiouridine synthesizing protein A
LFGREALGYDVAPANDLHTRRWHRGGHDPRSHLLSLLTRDGHRAARSTFLSSHSRTGGAPVSTTISTTVDARGQSCPGPLVSLAKALKDVDSGDLLELLATDPGSRSDVPSWAEISGNEVLASNESEGEFRYLIRKA